MHPRRGRTTAASSRTPRSSGGRSWTRAARARPRPGAPSTRSRSPTRARPSWRGTARPGGRSRRRSSWQDRRAASCASASPRRLGPRLAALTGPPARSVLRRRRRSRGCASTSRATASSRRPTPGCCTGLTGAYVTDAATASRYAAARPRRAATGRSEACTAFGVDAAALPRIVDCAEPVGATRVFGADAPGRGPRRRSAGRALRRALPRAGRREVHVRHRRVPARHRRRRAAALGAPASSAASRGDSAASTPTASTGRCTPRARPSWLHRPRSHRGADRPRRRRRSAGDAAGVVFVPALAGLGAPFWRPARARRLHRPHACDTRARTSSARRRRGHRRAGRVARARRERRPRRAARPPARRRWPHPLAHAHAGAGRPAAGAGRGVPVAARDRARRRGAARGSARGERGDRGEAVGGWSPAATSTSRGSARRRPTSGSARWRRAAEATLGLGA